MTFYQLNPTIPLRSPKASGEAVAVIDMSLEHDLMWVIIDDTTGQVWTVPNKDVRAYANYSAGRNLKPETPPNYDAVTADAVLYSFAAQWIAQPGATQRLLATCLDAAQVLKVLRMIAEHPAGLLQEGSASWMPDFMGGGKAMTVPTSNRDELRQAVAQRIGDCFAVALSGNRMPHMSGDPRARLAPHQLRELEDCAASAADAAIAAYEAHRPRADVVLKRDGWYLNVELTQEEWRTAILEGAAKMAGDEWQYPLDRPRFLYDAEAVIRAAFPWIRVEGE